MWQKLIARMQLFLFCWRMLDLLPWERQQGKHWRWLCRLFVEVFFRRPKLTSVVTTEVMPDYLFPCVIMLDDVLSEKNGNKLRVLSWILRILHTGSEKRYWRMMDRMWTLVDAVTGSVTERADITWYVELALCFHPRYTPAIHEEDHAFMLTMGKKHDGQI